MIRRKRTKRGLTLVELLVVVGVVSVIAAVMLPGIKSILTDRKSSQAAIMVKNYLEAARTRAIGRNRSVAVVFERLSSRATVDANGKYISETALGGPYATPDSNFVTYNACIRMSLAEEPLPLTEAMLPFPLEFIAREPGDQISPPIPAPGSYSGADELIDADQNQNVREVRIIQVRSTAGNRGLLAWLVGEVLVNGNEISFGDSARRFTIVTPRTPVPHKNHETNASDNSIWFSVMNERGYEGRGERAVEPYVDLPVGRPVSKFKIYSRPKPVFSQSVQLPRGMCVDLSLSGFGKKIPGQGNMIPEKQTVFDPAGAAMAGFDYRLRFASDWISNNPTPLEPWQLRPVYIVFSPEGQLSHVWANDRRATGDNGYQGSLTRIDATQDVFLHVGKIDRLTMPLDPDPQILGRNAYGFKGAIQLGVQNNLSDLSAYVVRLSPNSGAITASPIVNIDTQISILGLNVNDLNFGDMIELSRRGTYNSNVTAQ
jgi:prepilin-type N-terminal cleavage/methylation domain-containing protein